jgi:hypothetical protein
LILILDLNHTLARLHELSAGLEEADRKHAAWMARLKASGMFWMEDGTQRVRSSRVTLRSHRQDECRGRLHDTQHLQVRLAA